METVLCSFLRFRLSGDRVLPLYTCMRNASLALRLDMLRVGCNSSGISSMSVNEWPGWLKWELRDCHCGVCVEWIVCCLSMFLKPFMKCAFSLTSPYYCLLHLLHWIIYLRFVESQVMWCKVTGKWYNLLWRKCAATPSPRKTSSPVKIAFWPFLFS